jgi:hypothetical protein
MIMTTGYDVELSATLAVCFLKIAYGGLYIKVGLTPMPTISNTTIADDNSTIEVTFSEDVYSTKGRNGALTTSDFALTFNNNGGNATGASISGVSKNDGNPLAGGETVIRLNLYVNGVPDGKETVDINLAADSIYDAAGNAALMSQSNNTVTLKDKTPPTILSTAIADDNSTIDVTFSEAVYNNSTGTGSLTTDNFTLSISGGSATLALTNPSSITSSGTTYTLGVSLTGTPDGSEQLRVNPSSATEIYDAAGNAALILQSNNTNRVTLNDKTPPTILSTAIADDNSTIDVTFSEAVCSNSNGTGSLTTDNFTLSINEGAATLASSTPSSIGDQGNDTYRLGINLNDTPLPNGNEQLTVKPSSAAAIYDKAGNAALTSQSNNTVNLNV